MMTDKPYLLSPRGLRIVSWSVSVATFFAYAINQKSLVKPPSGILDGTFLWISLVFLLLPFVRSLKIAKIIELEREVEKTKETVREVREDVRQSLSVLTASLSATASARATVNNVVAVQGAEEHPEHSKPPSEAPRSAAELRILNTLWLFQIDKYPDLMPRFTFRIDAPPTDAEVFAQAALKLVLNGLISQTQDLQVFLTDAGLQYCRDHFRTFPFDIYFERRSRLKRTSRRPWARLSEGWLPNNAIHQSRHLKMSSLAQRPCVLVMAGVRRHANTL